MAPNPAFFETAAQVIPLLLIAGLIDYQGIPAPEDDKAGRHRLGGSERTLAITRLVSVAALVLAEVAALTAVAGRPTDGERVYVVGGMAVGGLAVVERFLDREFDRLNRTMRRPALVVTISLFLGAVIGPLIVIALVAGFA